MRNSAVVLCSDDIMLAGDVFMPDEPGGLYPAVCLCHGIPAVKYNPEEKGGYSELAASRVISPSVITAIPPQGQARSATASL